MLLRVQLPLAAAHSRDEGGALAAAILREQEVYVALGGKVLHRLLEDAGEAVEKDRGAWSDWPDVISALKLTTHKFEE